MSVRTIQYYAASQREGSRSVVHSEHKATVYLTLRDGGDVADLYLEVSQAVDKCQARLHFLFYMA